MPGGLMQRYSVYLLKALTSRQNISVGRGGAKKIPGISIGDKKLQLRGVFVVLSQSAPILWLITPSVPNNFMLAYNWLFQYNSQLYLLRFFILESGTGFEPV